MRTISVDEAIELLQSDELVVFPTETVYGLGANALTDAAIAKIFEAKGRPSDNPLIVHIGSFEQLSSLVEKVPEVAKKLIDAFWPGPLTLVFKSSDLVSSLATAGLNTVAIRMPAHPVAQELLQKSGLPLAAPSANISGKPSPTKVEHVEVDVPVIDGGECDVGLESTVVDVTGSPTLLRPGGVSVEQIEKIIGPITIADAKAEKPKSPGMKYRHYAPQAEVRLVEKEEIATVLEQEKGKKIAVIASQEFEHSVYVIDSLEQLAHDLFSLFYECDKKNVELIIFEKISSFGIGRAILNRVSRASL